MRNSLPDRRSLGQRHYVLNPGQWNWWVSLSHWQLEHYRSRFGDDFLVILARPGRDDDAYLIPFAILKHLLYGDGARPIYTEHWHATIKQGLLRIRGRTFYLAPFYNYFALADLFPPEAALVAA